MNSALLNLLSLSFERSIRFMQERLQGLQEKRIFRVLCLVILLVGGISTQKATAQVMVGDTSFWFAAPDLEETVLCTDHGDSPIMLLITNGSAQPATVSIWMYNGGVPLTETQIIPPNGCWKYDIPDANKGRIENPRGSAGSASNYGIHITSNTKVTAYYQVLCRCSQDIFTLKGTAAVDTLFYVPMAHDSYFFTGGSYPNAYDQVDIVATEDNTEVRVTVPTSTIVNTGGGANPWPANTELIRTLNKGQTLKIMEPTAKRNDAAPEQSLGGTRIRATHPVAVTSTEDLVGKTTGWDVIGDQIVPVSSLGKSYVVIKGYLTLNERVYVTATANNTTISLYDGSTTTPSPVLNAGDRWAFDIGPNGSTPNVVSISANEPFYCYHITGVGTELGSALLPSIYSISQTQVSYFQHTAEASDYHYLFLLFRDGTEGAFTISYEGGTTFTPALTVMNVPGMPDWKAAKYSPPATMHNKVVTIRNPESMFAMGYFEMNTTGGGASFGYISAFGTLQFPDTLYKCAGSTTTLSAGYGESYTWTGPGSFSALTSTITAADTGVYSVVVYQDPFYITASTRVVDRLIDASITATGGNDVGAGAYTYSVNLNGQTADNVGYRWYIDSIPAEVNVGTITRNWTNNDEHLIMLLVTDTLMGCSQMLSLAHHNLPDNMSDAACFVDPPASLWGIGVDFSSAGSIVSAFNIPLVGDLDDDGIPEIVCFGSAGQLGAPDKVQTMLIFNGKTHALIKTVALPTYLTAYDGAAYALFKRPIDRKGLIVIAFIDYKLRAYDIDGNLVWVSDENYGSVNGDFAVNLGFADFNLDGYPELYVRNKIYNASTGKLLAIANGGTNTGSSWSHYTHLPTWKLSSPMVADMFGDARPELILGNEIYSVTITDTTSQSGNAIDMVKSVVPPSGAIQDGHAQAVDFNKDGFLDLLITTRSDYIMDATVSAYVWDVKNNTVSSPLNIITSMSGKSIPLIADINNDGNLEILIQCAVKDSTNKFGCYKYDVVEKKFSWLWGFAPNEDSYSNTATLFDFNQDGMNEVLLTDQANVRILNGSGKSHLTGHDTLKVYVMAELAFSETTIMQYPVIADVDNDGAAEIVACGSGKLNIFKSSTSMPWASTRKVWNQYAYNVVNVNEDLTIPRYQLNPATKFAGGLQPYNNFLQQQTKLSITGAPLWLAPSPKVDSMFYFYDAVKDSMYITVNVVNTGDALFAAPFFITTYKNVLGAPTPRFTFSYSDTIYKQDTARIRFGIHDYMLFWGDVAQLVTRVNDRGDTFNDQDVCDSVFRDASDGRMLLAMHDIYNTTVNNPVKFDPKRNDSIPPRPVAIISALATHGSCFITAGDSIFYTPPPSYIGMDTLYYIISQENGKFTSRAAVYIYISQKPDNITESDCYLPAPTFGWEINLLKQSPVNYFAYGSPVLAGDVDGDGHVEIILNDGGPDLGTKLVILDDNLNVKYTLLCNESFVNTTVSFSIANVDGGAYAAIFIATTTTRQLKKFTLDISQMKYLEQWSVTYSENPNYDMGNPLICDFNGDGYAEVSVYDKIFDAQNGITLANGFFIPTGMNESNNLHKFGMGGGHPVSATVAKHASLMAAGDIDGDGLPELVGGNCVYKIIINSRTEVWQNGFNLLQHADETGHPEVGDGPTSLADMDLDGQLDVVVTRAISPTLHGLYIWNPRTGKVMHSDVVNALPVSNSGLFGPSLAAIGNLDEDALPEIAFIGFDYMYVYDYDANLQKLTQKWNMYVNDESGITLFDFNQNNRFEIVYRDFTKLMVIDGETHGELAHILCGSGTANEYPLILDVNNDGHAEFVIVAGGDNALNGTVRIYGSSTWASARKVWNQYAYNAVNVNDDLTIPAHPLNPSTVFAGADGFIGTADDIRPYNNYLQQQTALDYTGSPVWLVPDAHPVYDLSSSSFTDSIVSITLGVTNLGDAVLGPKVHVSLYKNNISGIALKSDSFPIEILPGDTALVTLSYVDTDALLNPYVVIARVNDSFPVWPALPECDLDNNLMRLGLMTKTSELNSRLHNGRYSNPVSVLYGEEITYTLRAANPATSGDQQVIFHDTLPAYLEATPLSFTPFDPVVEIFGSTPVRTAYTWTFDNVFPLEVKTISYKATPISGVCASQPLFINRAWVTTSEFDAPKLTATNAVYHQGAGIAIVTFSASLGGSIIGSDVFSGSTSGGNISGDAIKDDVSGYSASGYLTQAVDYSSTVRSGVLAVPDSGYIFVGWRHDAYVSLRGDSIPSAEGISHYEELKILGDITLQAVFLPESKANIALEQTTISNNSEDKIWSHKSTLHIRTQTTGSIARIYTISGVLYDQHTILTPGITTIHLPQGLYIVTLNNSAGVKVAIID